jgi:hypothetical protein
MNMNALTAAGAPRILKLSNKVDPQAPTVLPAALSYLDFFYFPYFLYLAQFVFTVHIRVQKD